jgi:hypothetical protein
VRHDIREYNDAATPEERVERSRNAGLASGRARRKYRVMRDLLKQVMLLDVSDPAMAEAMVQLGLEPTRANAIALSTVTKAGDGDIEAARFVRDTVGEKPTDTYNLGIAGKPIKSLDLSTLSDAELEALADSEG